MEYLNLPIIKYRVDRQQFVLQQVHDDICVVKKKTSYET